MARQPKPGEVANWIALKAMTLGECLDAYYSATGDTRYPLHTTTSANLLKIRRDKVLLRSEGYATFGREMFGPLKPGTNAIRVKPGHCGKSGGVPGSPQFVEWQEHDAAGLHFLYWPDGRGSGKFNTYIPIAILEVFRWDLGEHGVWQAV
ncbi:MAG: hypothetical protein R3C19_24750 [Planctomycetaceae bacterium]